jgi:hypothetical protein
MVWRSDPKGISTFSIKPGFSLPEKLRNRNIPDGYLKIFILMREIYFRIASGKVLKINHPLLLNTVYLISLAITGGY